MSQPARDSGVTLIEVLVTIALMGVVMAFGVAGWGSWSHARAQKETADELRTVLRSAQQRAITEGVSMCVSFTSTSYTVRRSNCSTGSVVDGPVKTEGDTKIAIPVANVTFAPRGTATGGDVTIGRPGSATTYLVKVESFTGRPYICHDGKCDE